MSVKYLLKYPLVEELTCICCHELMCLPTKLPCSHVFCKACIEKWLHKSRTCPICRGNYTKKETKADFKTQLEIDALKVYCKASGCNWQGSLRDITDHVESCKFQNPEEWAMPFLESETDKDSPSYQSLFSKLYEKFGDLMKPIINKSPKQIKKPANLKRKANNLEYFSKKLKRYPK